MLDSKELSRLKALAPADRNTEIRAQVKRVHQAVNDGTLDRDQVNDALDRISGVVGDPKDDRRGTTADYERTKFEAGHRPTEANDPRIADRDSRPTSTPTVQTPNDRRLADLASQPPHDTPGNPNRPFDPNRPGTFDPTNPGAHDPNRPGDPNHPGARDPNRSFDPTNPRDPNNSERPFDPNIG